MKKSKIIVIIVCALMLLGGYGLLSYLMSPKYLVKKYMDAYNKSDCNDIYEMTYIENRNKLTSLTNFKKLCESNISLMRNYKVSYFKKYAIVKSNNTEFRIDFVNTGNKKLFIFDEYLLKSNIVNTISNVEIIVPNNLESIKIGKTSMSDYKIESVNSVYDKIILGDVFEDTYELTATYEGQILKGNLHVSEEFKTQQFEFDNKPINVYMFSNPMCQHCQNALIYFDELKQGSYKKYFNLIVYDFNTNENLYNSVSTYFNKNFNGTPLFVIGDDYVEGFSSEYGDKILKKIMHAYRSNSKDVIIEI